MMIEGLGAELSYFLKASSIPPRLKEAMLYSFEAGGKRLRPQLLLSTCADLEGDVSKARYALLAVECVHTYSLIHDDLPALDNDDLRRGKPSCHKAFDEATAILAGDALLTLAFELLTYLPLPANSIVQAIQMLSRAAGPAGMVGGQMLDMTNSSDIVRMHQGKTGCLIGASIGIGAIVAGKNALAETLFTYGMKIGQAFQIIDDMLDATQSSQVLGKTAGKDAHYGKYTAVTLWTPQECKNLANQLLLEAQATLETIGKPFTALEKVSKKLIDRVY